MNATQPTKNRKSLSSHFKQEVERDAGWFERRKHTEMLWQSKLCFCRWRSLCRKEKRDGDTG